MQTISIGGSSFPSVLTAVWLTRHRPRSWKVYKGRRVLYQDLIEPQVILLTHPPTHPSTVLFAQAHVHHFHYAFQHPDRCIVRTRSCRLRRRTGLPALPWLPGLPRRHLCHNHFHRGWSADGHCHRHRDGHKDPLHPRGLDARANDILTTTTTTTTKTDSFTITDTTTTTKTATSSTTTSTTSTRSTTSTKTTTFTVDGPTTTVNPRLPGRR
ncbi:hypothetical protein A0H81_14069 [Grifola frondosa]|uniref:Uncharacterized protein n=1 Tax=Grifola frondosa TaxID=5627 RepID=A0A1C7LMZ8_GRIFR|nr:hypothetical protein A0H81_14069 [Grifola frondosa]